MFVKMAGENAASAKVTINNSQLEKEKEVEIDTSTEIKINDVCLKCENRNLARNLEFISLKYAR